MWSNSNCNSRQRTGIGARAEAFCLTRRVIDVRFASCHAVGSLRTAHPLPCAFKETIAAFKNSTRYPSGETAAPIARPAPRSDRLTQLCLDGETLLANDPSDGRSPEGANFAFDQTPTGLFRYRRGCTWSRPSSRGATTIWTSSAMPIIRNCRNASERERSRRDRAPGGRGIDNGRSMGSRLSNHHIVSDFQPRVVRSSGNESAYRNSRNQ